MMTTLMIIAGFALTGFAVCFLAKQIAALVIEMTK